MAQRPTEKLPERSQRSSRINCYSAAVRKCRELYGEPLAATLETLMVTTWWRRGHTARWYLTAMLSAGLIPHSPRTGPSFAKKGTSPAENTGFSHVAKTR